MDVNNLVQFMKMERVKSGLSMRALSDKCGVRPATISDIENGNVKGGIETITSILGGLGYELEPRKISGFQKI
jgi:transcriptional regulator with XRE-family HTH domain